MPDTDTKALAAIRPGDPASKLAAAIGDRWVEPAPAMGGRVDYLKHGLRFEARLTADGRVGRTTMLFNFDPEASVEGLHMLMPAEEVERARPDLRITTMPGMDWSRMGHRKVEGGTLMVSIDHGRIARMNLFGNEPRYDDTPPLPLPRPKRAFGIEVVRSLRPRGAPAPDGWAFGLPRGIAPEQWPLSWHSAMPLEHHFTVRVPEPYRTAGPERVALALFSEAAESRANDVEAMQDLMGRRFDGRALPDRVEPALQPFLDALRVAHPHAVPMRDGLGAGFTAIWLTEEEFGGAECDPPEPIVTTANAHVEPPAWMNMSGASRLFGWNGSEEFNPDYYLHRLAGRKPIGPWDIALLRVTEREDVNVGKWPVEGYEGDPNPDGYIAAYSEEWDEEELVQAEGDGQFGGTVYPAQGLPHVTPLFMGVEETMGMINMGGGSGQLDLATMRFHWAQ